MNREVLFVAEDVTKTTFMRGCDVFEPGKFVGILMRAVQRLDHAGPAADLLATVRRFDTPQFKIVGVIVPHNDAAFDPDYKVYSDGEQWIPVTDLCNMYGAQLNGR